MHFFITLVILFSIQISSSYAGIIIGGTRVIYNDNEREVSLGIKNPDKVAHLVQGWVEEIDNSKKGPFIVTPPIFKLEAGKENIVRIIFSGKSASYPSDRESAFWLNIKSVAATDQQLEDNNKLQIAVKTRIKLFFRPKGLDVATAKDAYKKLKFNKNGTVLTVENPTAYYITFQKLMVNGTEVKSSGSDSALKMMVSPFSSQEYKVNNEALGVVKWSSINDYGSITQEVSQKL